MRWILCCKKKIFITGIRISTMNCNPLLNYGLRNGSVITPIMDNHTTIPTMMAVLQQIWSRCGGSMRCIESTGVARGYCCQPVELRSGQNFSRAKHQRYASIKAEQRPVFLMACVKKCPVEGKV